MSFKIASSPYTHKARSTSQIMLWVILACIPGIMAQTYYFGYGNLIQITIAIISVLLAESLLLKLRNRPVIWHIKDNSALVTAVIIGICVPPLAPWWMMIIAACFAIIIAKQVYGGLGHNPFNPAMVGYVVLVIAFPVQMTSWLPIIELQGNVLSFSETVKTIFELQTYPTFDAISQATPLDFARTEFARQQTINIVLAAPIFGDFAGLGWQAVNIAFLIGGIFLLMLRIIHWHIPVSFLGMFTFCVVINWLISPEFTLPPLIHLLSGATMFGAFFIATDPVTASTTPLGRLIFGALIGFLVWLIRTYGGYPDAIAFSVLLANITVPLIDHYTQPKVYGHP